MKNLFVIIIIVLCLLTYIYAQVHNRQHKKKIYTNTPHTQYYNKQGRQTSHTHNIRVVTCSTCTTLGVKTSEQQYHKAITCFINFLFSLKAFYLIANHFMLPLPPSTTVCIYAYNLIVSHDDDDDDKQWFCRFNRGNIRVCVCVFNVNLVINVVIGVDELKKR